MPPLATRPRGNFTARIVVATSCWIAGCESPHSEPPVVNADTLEHNTGEETLPASATDVEIPSGSPDELFAFIAGLDSEPLPEDTAARSESLRIRMTKRVKVCDAILSQNVAPDAESSAVLMKLDALRTLALVDPDGEGADFQTYVTSLIEGADPYLARIAKAKRFQQIVNDFVSQRSEDSTAVFHELNELLDDKDADPRVFMELRDAIGWMVPHDGVEFSADQLQARMKLVAKCYRAIGDRFSRFEADAVASEAKGLLTLADQFELELLCGAARNGDKTSVDAVVSKLSKMFAAETPHGNELGFAIQTAQGLEFDGLLQPAMRLYEMAWKNVKSSEDIGLRGHVKRTLEKAGVRLNLIGKPMKIDGVLSDGTSFDSSDMSGKYVVMCFWESWVDSWLDEVKSIQAEIAKHDDKSIEIVSVNLDAPGKLKEYLANHHLNVPIVAGGEERRSGTESPLAVQYGVDMLPFTVLIGPDGNVMRIHVFGRHLAESLKDAT